MKALTFSRAEACASGMRPPFPVFTHSLVPRNNDALLVLLCCVTASPARWQLSQSSLSRLLGSPHPSTAQPRIQPLSLTKGEEERAVGVQMSLKVLRSGTHCLKFEPLNSCHSPSLLPARSSSPPLYCRWRAGLLPLNEMPVSLGVMTE